MPSGFYYVYALKDPRPGSALPFYIGKRHWQQGLRSSCKPRWYSEVCAYKGNNECWARNL